jgi:hypothetical protein
MSRYLAYRAGPFALERIATRGFSMADVRTLIAPATGPKWLVAVGFDRALLREGVLGRGESVLLAGASAGAWRALAFASPDALAAHERLFEQYVEMVFTTQDSPERISAAYRELLQRVVPSAHIAHALAHPNFRLALHAVRVKGWTGSSRGTVQKAALGAAAVGHALLQASAGLFFEPTLFASEATPRAWLDRHALPAALTAENLHEVALASGSVPIYMEPIAIGRDDEAGVRRLYLDGGLSDYHLRRRLGDAQQLALLFSHQRRIVPTWFDKYLPWRMPSHEATNNLLLVYPTEEFFALLPDGQVPSRDDFMRFVARPRERIQRWRAAAALSERLGDQFLEDLAHDRIARWVQPL